VIVCPYCGDALTDPRRVWCGKPTCKKQRDRDRIHEFHERVKRETGRPYKAPCRKHGNKHAAIYEHVCPWCGKTFKNHKKACLDGSSPHCSVGCYMAACEERREERKRQKRLPVLHTNPDRTTARWLRRVADRTSQGGTKGRFIGGTCKRCGSTFVSRESGPHAFCSDKCAHRHHEHVRRMRRRGAGCAPYARHEVFERDAWRCHICGKRVRRNVGACHSLAPTIDHLVPLADGGTDELSNVACAHFICNSLRSNTGEAQLLLMG